jgi:hypothetical protein
MEPISRLFTDRSTTLHGHRWELQVVNLGSFRLPSGILAASDGFYPEPHRSGEALPTEAGVLELAIAVREDGDQQVIAARIRYSESPVDDWYPLHFRGAKAVECESGLLWADSEIMPLKGEAPEAVEAQLKENSRPTRSWAAGEIQGASYAIVECGLGKGAFYFHKGIDEDGNVVALLIDFAGILQEGWE